MSKDIRITTVDADRRTRARLAAAAREQQGRIIDWALRTGRYDLIEDDETVVTVRPRRVKHAK